MHTEERKLFKIPWVGLLIFLILFGFLMGYFFSEILVSFIFEKNEALKRFWPVALTLYTFFFCIAMSLILPFTPLCVMCGFFLAGPLGVVVQFVCIALSSALIFAITARLDKDNIKSSLSQYGLEKYANALERIRENKWQNAKINFLLCMVPMPYGVHVYIFALFECPFFLFIIPFQIGMLPHVLCNLFVGSSIADNVAPQKSEEHATNNGFWVQTLIWVVISFGALAVVQNLVSQNLVSEEKEDVII